MWLFSRRGPSGFSASSTAEEVTQGIDGSGLTAIVTGASSGIGSETARVLALRGVHVIMGIRNMEAGREVKESIIKENPSAKVHAMELDLSSLASVRKFAADFRSLDLPLNILINNAGIMATPFTLSKDNIELQFATNHIGHYLLTNLLMDTIKKTAGGSRKEGRIVNVASRRHKFSYPEGIHFSKINDPSGYNDLAAYGQSKLANILHANELARRLQEDGEEVTANSVHPGPITTNLFRHHLILKGLVDLLGLLKAAAPNLDEVLLLETKSTFTSELFRNLCQAIRSMGAATTCYVALHPQVKGLSGRYFSDSNIAEASLQATDAKLARKLWDFSLDLINSCPSA